MDLQVNASSACNDLRMLKAACDCWCAIVRSEKTHTRACNEFWLLICLRAVREGPRIALARKEFRMLRHRRAVGKPIVTHQRWRINSGDSSNLPFFFASTWPLVTADLQLAPRCASKKHDPACLFCNPLIQPNIGCNSGSKKEQKGFQY